jgi:transglutaminase-like putative cysteine protease
MRAERSKAPKPLTKRSIAGPVHVGTLVFFVEAARKLAFGARLVSGYLHDPDRDLLGSAEAGSTHAWAEVFIPGAGWITFDPTNRSVGGRNLIPVAVGRDIAQCTPVSGSFYGPADSFLNMDVSVSVSS